LRNKANFNIGSLILPLINKENPSYLANLNKFKLEPFYDYGHVQTRYNNAGGRLAGAGVKTIFESQYFNASLTYSWATNRSKLLTATQKENKMLYFEISASCC
jgi:hemolysin activation/secretion protein